MSNLTLQSQVSIAKKEYLMEDVLKTIIYLPQEQVVDFFKNVGLTVPRSLRIDALREVLHNSILETIEERKTLADELGYRLRWFNKFAELQLENMLEFYNNASLKRTYLVQLWLRLFEYVFEKRVPEELLEQFILSSVSYVKAQGLVLPNTKKYNWALSEVMFDQPGEIDGLTPEQLRPILFNSSTITEIRELGLKYHVDVPKRLKKNELADIIVQELKDRNEYSEAEEKKVRDMTILIMQRYAIDHKIKASTELKKEEVIEYILQNAKETKEAYYVPSKSVYGLEAEEVAVTREEVVPVDIVEESEVIEEEPKVVEEIVPVETHVEENVRYVQQATSQELIDELREIRNAINHLEVSVNVGEATAEKPLDLHLGALVVNAADFEGNKKEWKRTHKSMSKVEVQEDILEDQNTPQTETIQKVEIVEEVKKSNTPFELRVIGKLLFKLFKIVFTLAIIAIVLLIIYALVTSFVELDFLDSVTETINKIKIGGKGILQILYDFFESIGIKKAN